ncbi:MAG TPA: NAD(P)-dependent oxidoreductase, partial [Nocardioides sp.]
MSSEHAVPYPAGLILEGRRVVVVGGGRVAQRRVPALIAAGARVEVVSPSLTPALEGLLGSGEITWHQARFSADVLDDAWYVIAATQNADVNEEISAAAEERRIFCVRSDDGTQATAWTPAT